MLTFQEALDSTEEYGVAEELRYPLILVRGLPGATNDELVVFENNQYGQVFSLSNDIVEIIVLSDTPVNPGMKVARTGEHLMVPMGNFLRGSVINPLGKVLLQGEKEGESKEDKRGTDPEPPHINKRKRITKPLLTGTSIVDLLLPLGKGQRQMVLGDQKTGKTSFLLSTLKECAEDSTVVIYAAIGKPWDAIAEVHNFIRESDFKHNTVIVASTASDVSSLIVLAPFTAMTIAEYFRDAGIDTLVIFDDLSTHATVYREISLLARRFPGRESYPGDIFHLHARLLERAGNFTHEKNEEAAITCLPVAETVYNNLTSHIVSNLISITDGHLLFDTAIFNQGQRPAIDTSLSVTRVGRQTQSKLAKELQRKLNATLSQHAQAKNYAQFGAELSEELREALLVGNQLVEFFSQPPFYTVPPPIQFIITAIIENGWLKEEPEEKVSQWRDKLNKLYISDKKAAQLIDSIVNVDTLAELQKNLDNRKDYLIGLCGTETR